MSVPTNDSAKIGLVSEIKIVSSRMNLSATSGHAERVDLNMLQNRNHPSQFRWLMHKVHSMLSLAVRKTTVFVQFGIVHEPISNSNIASVDVRFVRI